MKLQRSTIILMFGALLMGGAFYYYETLIIPAQEAKEAFAKKLFKFTKEDVQSLVVTTESKTLRFERDSESSAPKDLWFMEILEISETPAEETATTEETTTEETEETAEPTATNEETANTEDVTDVTTEESTETTEESAAETAEITATNQEPATNEESTESTSDDNQTAPTPEPSGEKIYGNEAYVSFLLEQLVSDRYSQTFTATPEQLPEYDLNPPVATIEITLKDRKNHKLTLGKSEFSGNYIYAQVDPPTLDITTQPVVIVSKNFEYGVDRPLEDWKQPPEILEENPESAEEMSEEDSQNSSESSEETLEEPKETPEASDSSNPTDDETDPASDDESLDRTEDNSANSPETSDKNNTEAAEEAADN